MLENLLIENSMKKCLLMTLLGASIVFSSNAIASDLDTSGGSHEELVLTGKDLKALKSAKWVLHSDISDEQWDDLPTKVSTLDISKLDISQVSSISKFGLEKMSTMKINTLDLSNLRLVDEDLKFLPKELKRLFLKNTSIKGNSLRYLPETVEEIDISSASISVESLKQLLEKNIQIINKDNYEWGVLLWQLGKNKEAFALIKQEADVDENNVHALYNVAIMFRDGIGIDKDINQCIAYCEKASNKGSLLALNQLGLIYELGLDGLEKNEDKAIEYYMQAADRGLEISIKNLERILGEENE